jgi:hypothetical protein
MCGITQNRFHAFRRAPRSSLFSLLAVLIPERIKIEPVIRRHSGVVLEPRDIPLHPRLNFLSAMFPVQYDLVGEVFEVNVVTISAALQTKK